MEDFVEFELEGSVAAKNTFNPIRALVDTMKMQPNPEKEKIPLSIGDPTVFGNFQTPNAVTEAVVEAARSGKFNGYPHSAGYEESRAAVAKYYSTEKSPLTADDVVLTSGCSGAICLVIPALANPGDNVLLPKPGFSLYNTVCGSYGIEARFYNLLPENEWQADLAHMESCIDEKTKAILVNSPGNPCGCVYPKEHLEDIIKLAKKYKLPIIADEIYANMAFPPYQFHAMADLTDDVPIITVGGLAKRWLVPGWRLGWIMFHDKKQPQMKKVRAAVIALSQLILGPNAVLQGALPAIFENTPQTFYNETLTKLADHANFVKDSLSRAKGLSVVVPQGAMYVMVGIDTSVFPDKVNNDKKFAEALFQEESVFVLPGRVFGAENFFRIVFTAPKEKLAEACSRIVSFCDRYAGN